MHTQIKFGQSWQLGIAVLLTLVEVVAGVGDRTFAQSQIVPDKTLGTESSVVTPNVEIHGLTSDRIDGGAIRGTNLFHSFQDFNVGEGKGVYFTNPQGIENILGRVTGANRSEILGRLGVLGNANLFLLNPNGIVFGENASLDVQGSFFATTAEAIALGKQGYFSATQPQQSSLLSVSPGAEFFNQAASQPGNIINRGNLSAGKDLTLAGGNLDLQGQLYAGENLTLQATDTAKIRDSEANPFLARSGGDLAIVGNQAIDILALNHPTQTPFVSGGNLSLISDGTISGDARFSSGGSFSIHNLSGGLANFISKYDPIISSNGDVDFAGNYTGASLLVESKGNIRIQGGVNITSPDTSALPAGQDTATLSKSTALIMRSGQNTLAYEGANPGVPTSSSSSVPVGITLNGNVILQPYNNSGGIVSLSAALGDVNTKLISINGTQNRDSITLSNEGKINLEATNGNIKTGDLFSFSRSGNGIAGRGGAINLTANGSITTDRLNSSSFSESGGASQGGDISIFAAKGDIKTSSLASNSRSQNSVKAENGGSINLFAINGNIYVDDLNSYSSSNSGNAGNGGEINISASNGSILIGDLNARSFSNSSGSAGNGGAIALTAKGNITTGGMNSEAEGTGNGGDITLTSNAGAIDTTKGAITSQIRQDSNGSGRAGTIVFTAKDNIQTAQLDASAETGDGSNIQLTSTNGAIDTTKGTLYTDTRLIDSGNGGKITLQAEGDITTKGMSSDGGTFGISGDITITSDTGKILVNGGQINSENYGTSEGGDINITATAGSISLNGAVLSASTNGQGNAGSINIFAHDTVSFDRSEASTSTQTNSTGNGGDINIAATAGSISLNGAVLSASTSGQGDAGSVKIVAPKSMTFVDNSTVRSLVEGEGNSGGISIDTGSLTVANNSELNSSTTSGGKGRAGDITIKARDLVLFDGGFALSRLEKGGSGRAGDIRITTDGSVRVTGIPSNVADAQIGQLVSATFGEGDAGSITIEAGNNVEFDGRGSDAYTLVASDRGVGNAGNITIDSRSLSVRNGARLVARTENQGNAGSVNVIAKDFVSLNNGFIDSLVTREAVGKGGGINISADSLSLTNGAKIQTDTSGQGNAGKIEINASDFVSVSGSSGLFTSTASNSGGQAGDITVNVPEIQLSGSKSGLFAQTSSTAKAGNLVLQPFGNAQTLRVNFQDGAQISASTSSTGQGGSLSIKAPQAATISGNGQLSVETNGAGVGGELNIDTQQLTIQDEAQVSASTSSLNPSGKGGNIIVNATQSLDLSNKASLLAQSNGAAPAGNVTINARNLTARNSRIATSATEKAASSSRGGNIEVKSSQVNLQGNDSGLFALTQGAAPAGSLILNPDNNGQILRINLQDNAKISASTFGSGQGGSLSIKAPQAATISGNGQLSAETRGAGPGGNLNIDTHRLTIQDGAQVSASTSSLNPSGKGGSITVNATQSLDLSNEASLRAQSTGAAPAGNITIHTRNLTARNGSKARNPIIETSSAQASGGNITISREDSTNPDNPIRADKIRLYGDSDITTSVGSGKGNGGKITLAADSIIAFKDSDILAYAQDGTGGDIEFKTPAFFGQNYKPAPADTAPSTLDDNDRVDVNARGAVSGVITLPDTSFIQNSLSELPQNLIDTSTLIANSCIARTSRQQQGSFTITGSGGLPTRPEDALMSTYTFGNVRSVSNADPSANSTRRPWRKGDPIVEPQGVYRLSSGQLVLSRECP